MPTKIGFSSFHFVSSSGSLPFVLCLVPFFPAH
ncbi:hypothetical protein CPAR01_03202 [Colletotrichum paranaense]|uniref:Uncharacterized protein n=1 Tax=Colletotrichum paranaense TaxID=1914294 RepID=A0ABQ9T1P4_9PEZI|nr:uncharacterized protein CPAR01_03202 [Colletotrichum paranaense]KAK1545700.1 hypothetical protein CPAR01_03202 [Colletotrichum paranaense]